MRPRIRTGLIFVGTFLALSAILRADLPIPVAVSIALLVIGLALRAGRQGAGMHRLERIGGGRIRLQPPTGPGLDGELRPAYCSGFYCAFTIRDPIAGLQRIGLFRDELEADAWRRLRVALRTQARH